MERKPTVCWDEIKIPYLENIKKSETKRKTFKKKFLVLNPEHLYADATVKGEWVTNLIFYTSRPTIWQKSICTTYDVTRVTLRAIQCGSQVTILDPNDTSSKSLDINIYDTGKVVINGNDVSLWEFKSTFFELKTKMEESVHKKSKSEESDEKEEVEAKEEENPPAQPDPAPTLAMENLKL